MDPDSIITVIALAVCLVLSAYFSATETAFSSFNRIRIKSMAENGDKRAARVLKMSENFDALLSTILVGNNIVNIAAASIATVMFVKHFGDIGATLSTVAVTLVVLIFGEISPKGLAKESPERFAMFAAPFLKVLTIILFPINFVFGLWKKLLGKMFKIKSDDVVTEDELLTIVDEAQTDGGIDEDEGALIRSAIEFGDLQAADIFTPRVSVEAIKYDEKPSEIAETFAKSGYSRLPVYEDNIDNIIGVLHQKDFYNYVYHHDKTVADVMKPPLFITGSMPLDDLLRRLQAEKSHMAIIADEYGGTEGIVTMEDVLEELVGEIWDEHDDVTSNISKIGERRYKIDGLTDLDEFSEYFDINTPSDSASVGGWVMEKLGRIAKVGDEFDFENMTVHITATEDRRVREIVIDVNE